MVASELPLSIARGVPAVSNRRAVSRSTKIPSTRSRPVVGREIHKFCNAVPRCLMQTR